MKNTKLKGMWVKVVRKTAKGFIFAPSIFISTDEVPADKNQYKNAIAAAKEKSSLSNFQSWRFV